MLTYICRSWYPPCQWSKKFWQTCTHKITAPSHPHHLPSVIATMAIDCSNFGPIRERRNQVYAIKRERIVFTKRIVVNEAWLRHFEEYSLRSVLVVCPVCTAECRASLVKVKLICYLGRPSKGQTKGTIHLDDSHFTLWLHVYMLTDIHSPLPDRNLRNVDMRCDTIIVFSLPIRHSWQHCLRAVCDVLIEVILPPSPPNHHASQEQQIDLAN